jgi:hypothetical protein
MDTIGSVQVSLGYTNMAFSFVYLHEHVRFAVRMHGY